MTQDEFNQLTPQQQQEYIKQQQAAQQQPPQGVGSNMVAPVAIVAAPLVNKAVSSGVSAVGNMLSGGSSAETVVPTAQEWANWAGAPGAQSSSMSSLFTSTGGRVFQGAAGAYGLYNLFNTPQNRTGTGRAVVQGAGSGAALGGSIVPGVGHVVGGIAGGIGGLIHNLTGSTRGVDTKERDLYRRTLEQAGFLDDKYMSKPLSSGATFDWGLDVNNKESLGGDANVPWYIKPEEAEISAQLDPLGHLMGGGNQNLSVTSTGFLTRTATSKGDPMKNVRELYDQLGYGDYTKDRATFEDMAKQGMIDNATKDAQINALDKVFGVGAYAKPGSNTSNGGGGSSSGGGKQKTPKPAPPPSLSGILPTLSQPAAPTEPDRNAHYLKMLSNLSGGTYQPYLGA